MALQLPRTASCGPRRMRPRGAGPDGHRGLPHHVRDLLPHPGAAGARAAGRVSAGACRVGHSARAPPSSEVWQPEVAPLHLAACACKIMPSTVLRRLPHGKPQVAPGAACQDSRTALVCTRIHAHRTLCTCGASKLHEPIAGAKCANMRRFYLHCTWGGGHKLLVCVGGRSIPLLGD